MTEIQFLVDLLMRPDATSEMKELIASRIKELSAFPYVTVTPQITTPYIPYIYGPVDVCQHEYPQPWFGTVPPNCKKCGQNMSVPTVTCGTYSVQKAN